MREYKFNNQVIEMDIAGNIFKVDVSEGGFMKKLSEIRAEAKEQAEKTSKDIDENGDLLNVYEESKTFFKGAIDALLGEGATDLIFKERRANPFDMLDILGFVSDAITEETTNKTSDVYLNRARRRADHKK